MGGMDSPALSVDVVAEMLGITDIEGLILDLVSIRDFFNAGGE